jgi:hypothetical protein
MRCLGYHQEEAPARDALARLERKAAKETAKRPESTLQGHEVLRGAGVLCRSLHSSRLTFRAD